MESYIREAGSARGVFSSHRHFSANWLRLIRIAWLLFLSLAKRGWGLMRGGAACYSVILHSVIVISEQNIVIRYLFSGHWDELAHIARSGCSRRDMRAGGPVCLPKPERQTLIHY